MEGSASEDEAGEEMPRGMSKMWAAIVLLFLLYCFINVVVKRRFYSPVHLSIWLIIIGAGAGWCLAALLLR